MGDARLDQRPKQVQKESFLTANTPWKAIAMYLLTSSLTVLEEARLYRVSKIKSVKKKRLELGREAYLTPH